MRLWHTYWTLDTLPGTGKNGGVSATKPAVGADAEQGGNSASSQDGNSASGLGLNTVVSQFVGGE